MPHRGVLLAVESPGYNRLVRVLTALRYSVVTVEGLDRALAKIRHLTFAAAVVRGNIDLDPLEFVLNAREVDATIPIVVVAEDPERNLVEALEKRPRVWVLEEPGPDLKDRVGPLIEKASR